MTNGEMFKEVFGYDLYCKECHDGWRNYEYKGSVHYHFDPEKGRYINDNPPFIPLSVIEDIKAEIEELGIWHEKLLIETIDINRVLEIIDRKIKEIKHECSACTHSDEVDGEHCYECVKGITDNFEAVEVTKNE